MKNNNTAHCVVKIIHFNIYTQALQAGYFFLICQFGRELVHRQGIYYYYDLTAQEMV